MEVNEKILEFLKDEPLENMEGLDLGCGTGNMTFLLAEKMKKMTGIDISREAIGKAKRATDEKGIENVEFHVADAYRADYRKYVGISLISSRFFMSEELIEKAGQVLERGGIFVFACFHEDNLKEFWECGFGFSPEVLEHHFEKSGFKLEEIQILTETATYESKEEMIDDFPYARKHWKMSKWKALMDYFDSGGRQLTFSNMVGKAVKL